MTNTNFKANDISTLSAKQLLARDIEVNDPVFYVVSDDLTVKGGIYLGFKETSNAYIISFFNTNSDELDVVEVSDDNDTTVYMSLLEPDAVANIAIYNAEGSFKSLN